MTKIAQCVLTLIAFFSISFTSFADSTGQSIIIGLVPEMNVFEQYDRYKQLAQYITDKTGVKIKVKILNEYGNIIDNYMEMKLNGAFFGSFTGVLAHEKLGVEALVRPITPDGQSVYHGHLFVRKDSGIKNVRDMKGKVIAFVDRASSCGYIYPLAYLRENGVTDIDSYFEEYYFTGSHDAVLYAVLNGKADIGVVKNTVYDRFMKQDLRVSEELLILDESLPFPSHGLFISATVDHDVKKKLKDAFLDMDKDENGKSALKKFGAVKFVETDVKKDYGSVFEVAGKAGIDLKKYDYQNE